MSRPPSPLTVLFSRHTGRREFIAGFGTLSITLPLAASAQQKSLPVVAFIGPLSPEASVRHLAAFRAGLGELGYVEGRNVGISYHWLNGNYDRVPSIMADLVQSRVAVIASPGGGPQIARAAKTATTSIPIIFGIGEDPVSEGLVASIARPGGNATGMNFFMTEAVPKRLGLLREMTPKAKHVSVLTDPLTEQSQRELGAVQDSARDIGVPVSIFQANSSREIEDAFAMMNDKGTEALFILGNSYFGSRLLQLATLATRYRIASSYPTREFAEAGGLMSYGPDLADTYRQGGVYAGRILRGEKPEELPVVQSTKFQFVINLPTARAIGIDVPPRLIALSTDVIE
jgi:putative tryptophan/tyrosine transport system substrate-binding protein